MKKQTAIKNGGIFRRGRSFALVLALLLTLLPIGAPKAYAVSNPDTYTFDISEGNIDITDSNTAGLLKVRYGANKVLDNISSSQTLTLTGTTTVHSVYISTRSAVVQLQNLTINNLGARNIERAPLTVAGNSGEITIKLSGKNHLEGAESFAGLFKDYGDSRLILTSAAGDGSESGELTALGNDEAAGIGGQAAGEEESTNNITINGGTIRAAGVTGAGIGIGGDDFGPQAYSLQHYHQRRRGNLRQCAPRRISNILGDWGDRKLFDQDNWRTNRSI